VTEPASGIAPGQIVVGVDGSPNARRALRFAIDEAELWGCPLEVIHAWHTPRLGTPDGYPPDLVRAGRLDDTAHALLEHELGATPDIEVHLHTHHGSPARVLVERSTRASLVVVGRHGTGFHPLLGNVADQVAHHAACPVAVVPDNPPGGSNSKIIFGVDGSPEAAAAARWAHAEARQRKVRLVAVLAWPLIDQLVRQRPTDLELPYDDQQAQHLLDTVLNHVLGADAGTVERQTVGALAADALQQAAQDAALTVVGARGLGGFHALLVGSVSRKLIQTAPTPTVVVRAPTRP
jgi:nucleotide-binding universal stress UspA family protein